MTQDWSGVRVVFHGPHGFVTDFGRALPLQDLTGRVTCVVPRYGVWKHDVGKGKHQVMTTTDDLIEAISEASRR